MDQEVGVHGREHSEGGRGSGALDRNREARGCPSGCRSASAPSGARGQSGDAALTRPPPVRSRRKSRRKIPIRPGLPLSFGFWKHGMKIAHINNIANVAWHLAQAQKRLGHEAVVFSLDESPFAFPRDVTIRGARGPLGWNARM